MMVIFDVMFIQQIRAAGTWNPHFCTDVMVHCVHIFTGVNSCCFPNDGIIDY